MEEKRNILYSYAIGLKGDRLVRDILTDKSMDGITANDIVKEEIITHYPALDVVAIIRADGQRMALNILSATFRQFLKKSVVLNQAYQGEIASGYHIYKDRCIQFMALPVYINEEMIGVVMVGTLLRYEDLKQIKKMSGADLSFFYQDKAILTTYWNQKNTHDQQLRNNLENIYLKIKDLSNVYESLLYHERYIFIKTRDDAGFLPDYMVGKSLDKQLAFIEDIKMDTIYMGFIAICLGIGFSIMFALGISKPIQVLKKATEAVKNQQFNYRLNIQTKDEFATLGASFNHMIEGLAERERIRGVINKVVSKQIADEMLTGNIQLGGEEREVTILFTDIRGFTALSENLDAHVLVDLLNRYLTSATQAIDNHRGVIDKYIGDAIMALFGAPLYSPLDARNAVHAAQDLVEQLALFNREIEAQLGITLNIGIGICTGNVIAGNMGSMDRLNYTVLGDSVNTASRAEGLTKQYGIQIAITESTRQALQDDHYQGEREIICRPVEKVLVKGKNEKVMIYQVLTPSQLNCEHTDQHIEKYIQAYQLLIEQKFEEALDLFKAIHADCPNDGPVNLFLNRCQRYLDHPHLFDIEYGDGCYRATDK